MFGMATVAKTLSWILVCHWKQMDLVMEISSSQMDYHASGEKLRPFFGTLLRAQAESGLLWARSNIKP
jgi:hypothetical protein